MAVRIGLSTSQLGTDYSMSRYLISLFRLLKTMTVQSLDSEEILLWKLSVLPRVKVHDEPVCVSASPGSSIVNHRIHSDLTSIDIIMAQIPNLSSHIREKIQNVAASVSVENCPIEYVNIFASINTRLSSKISSLTMLRELRITITAVLSNETRA